MKYDGTLNLNGIQNLKCEHPEHPHEGPCRWSNLAVNKDWPDNTHYLIGVVVNWFPNPDACECVKSSLMK